MMRDRRLGLAAAAVLVVALVAANPPRADIRVLAHQASDPAPHRVQAAIDLGIAAISILVTWTTLD